MKTPTPAELRVAKAIHQGFIDDSLFPQMPHSVALAISTELHLDEVREALADALTLFRLMAGRGGKESHWHAKAQQAQRALDFLTK